jgi:hypothetical protein
LEDLGIDGKITLEHIFYMLGECGIIELYMMQWRTLVSTVFIIPVPQNVGISLTN